MVHAIPLDLAIATRDGRLRIEFHSQDDRIIQRLFVDSLDVGASIEGDSNDVWPSSPPLQQLSLEDINGSNVILGVGAAGRGHWSISVESDAPCEGPDGIRFDLACRSSERPAFLGSSYRLSDEIVLTASVGRYEVRNDRVIVGPLDLDSHELDSNVFDAQTYRWSYRLTPA